MRKKKLVSYPAEALPIVLGFTQLRTNSKIWERDKRKKNFNELQLDQRWQNSPTRLGRVDRNDDTHALV